MCYIYFTMVKRKLNLFNILQDRYSTFLFGPRGTGKSYLCGEYLKQKELSFAVDLLRLSTQERYIARPDLFRMDIESQLAKVTSGSNLLVVLVDEVQKMPRLLDDVHSLIEQHKDRLQFILTGSSARKLKRREANLLAGRALTLHLHPFSSAEIELDLERALQFGTLPAVYQDYHAPQRILNAYVETYLKEEILQEGLVRKAESFIQFLQLAGQLNSEPVTISKLARQCRVSPNTLSEYFQILVDTLLALRVPAWSYSVRAQLSTQPKYYLFDCGVLNQTRGELSTDLKPASYRFGKLFETFIANELSRYNDYMETGFSIYHWRTQRGEFEVDFILSRGPADIPKAIEVKSSPHPDPQDLKGLLAFKREYPEAELFCFCLTEREYQEQGISVLPWRKGLSRLFNA